MCSSSLLGEHMERSKYNVDGDKSQRTCDGIVFDSAMEMKYYRDVVLPGIEAGGILRYELQKKYVLQPKFKYDGRSVHEIAYVADFYIEYADGHSEVIDIKGCPDSVAKLKRKLFWYVYPDITYRWVTLVKKYGGWIDYEDCLRLRKADKLKRNKGDTQK